MLNDTTVWFADRATDAYGDIRKWWAPTPKKHAHQPLNVLAASDEQWIHFFDGLSEEVLLDGMDAETVLLTGIEVVGGGDRLRSKHAERLRAVASELHATSPSWRLGLQVETGKPSQGLQQQIREVVGHEIKFTVVGAGWSTRQRQKRYGELLQQLLQDSSLPAVEPNLDREQLLDDLSVISHVNLQGSDAAHDPRVVPERWARLQKHLWEYRSGPLLKDRTEVALDLLLAGIVMSVPEGGAV